MAKKSRRARRQSTAKQQPKQVAESTAISTPPPPVEDSQSIGDSADEPQISRRMANFAKEYFYVYQELRTILIVALLMFAVLFGLSFVI